VIDLLLGGSPCQGFSFAGKQLNFDDPRSKLFFDYVKALEVLKPRYFLLENVKMKKEYQDVISRYLRVEPIEINSALVSAQNRKRLYWTNIPGIEQPEDKGIMLKDIVHENVDIKSSICTNSGKAYALTASYDGAVWWNSVERKQRTMVFEELAEYIVPFDKTLQILDKEAQRGKIGYFRTDSQANRVYYIHDKAVTLCGEAGGGAAKMGQYLFGEVKKNYFQYDLSGKGHNSQDQRAYYLDGKHGTLPSSSASSKCKVLFGCITPDRVNKRQNGQRFNNGKKFYTLTAQDKHGILIEGYIRRLTPIECERLQTLPDNYTEGISNSQRYKCLGNGWTVDVIAHILSCIPDAHLHNVVSLFDGISCGQVALGRANKAYSNYYASEIDKYAISVAVKNYPNTIQLGDITKIDWNELKGACKV
jgi:DNA (cytosine-5)-methyltransferase 3A